MFNALRKRKFNYKIEEVSPQAIRGWIFNSKSPSDPVWLRLYLDGQLVSEFQTNVHREKVNEKFGLEGKSGFKTQLPLAWFDGKTHNLELKVLDKGREVSLQAIPLHEKFDSVCYKIESCDANGLRGWVYDAENTDRSSHLRIYVDEKLIDEFETHIERSDVNRKHAIQGVHGFRRLFPMEYFDNQPHTVCLTVVRDKEYPLEELALQESLDDVSGKLEQIEFYRVKGWAYSRLDPEHPLQLKIYCNDEKLSTLETDEHRPDVNRQHGIQGNHGFRYALPLDRLQDQENLVSVILVHGNQEICLGKKLVSQDVKYIKDTVRALQERMEKQKQEWKSKHQAVQEELQKVREEKSALDQELTFARQQAQQSRNAYQQLEEEKRSLSEELENSKQRIRSLEKSNRQLQQSLQEVEKKFEELEEFLSEADE